MSDYDPCSVCFQHDVCGSWCGYYDENQRVGKLMQRK